MRAWSGWVLLPCQRGQNRGALQRLLVYREETAATATPRSSEHGDDSHIFLQYPITVFLLLMSKHLNQQRLCFIVEDEIVHLQGVTGGHFPME